MNFLLDTNVVSEWVKPHPDVGLMAWMESVDEDRVFISVVTLAELRYGTERLPQGKRRMQLERWLHEELPLRFESRIIPVSARIADVWGRTVARSESAGRPMGIIDAFLSATVQVNGLTLVTRNTSDFPFLRAILNPWKN